MTLRSSVVKIIATSFGAGFVPVMPGTAGTLVGVGLYLLLRGNIAVYAVATIIITAVGFWVSGEAEKLFAKKDAQQIVIDETSGIMIALFLLPAAVPVVVTAFFLFRGFDMFKVPPADKLQNIPGGAGVMLDDVVAGLYTNICFQVALRLLSIITS